MIVRAWVLAIAVAAACTMGGAVQALEIQGEFGLNGTQSSWDGDIGAGGQLRMGVRLWRLVTVDFAGWTQYARVDQRANTGLTLGIGATLPMQTFRPTLRLYAVHQHEEGLVSVKAHPWGTLFGIGAGIRHRAGGGVSLGAEVPFARTRFGELFLFGNGSATAFPDTSLGPLIYAGIAVGIGVNYLIVPGDQPK